MEAREDRAFGARFALCRCLMLAHTGRCVQAPYSPRSHHDHLVADWVENIGGDHVEVFSLVPVGSDPHAFRPGARDITKIADADLVLSIGLGLEESWLKKLLQNAARDPSTIVELGESVDPIEFAELHAGEVAILEELNHVVLEVEEGEIGPEAALEEIKELLGGADGDKAEEELPGMVLAIVNDVEEGRMGAATR